MARKKRLPDQIRKINFCIGSAKCYLPHCRKKQISVIESGVSCWFCPQSRRALIVVGVKEPGAEGPFFVAGELFFSPEEGDPWPDLVQALREYNFSKNCGPVSLPAKGGIDWPLVFCESEQKIENGTILKFFSRRNAMRRSGREFAALCAGGNNFSLHVKEVRPGGWHGNGGKHGG